MCVLACRSRPQGKCLLCPQLLRRWGAWAHRRKFVDSAAYAADKTDTGAISCKYTPKQLQVVLHAAQKALRSSSQRWRANSDQRGSLLTADPNNFDLTILNRIVVIEMLDLGEQ